MVVDSKHIIAVKTRTWRRIGEALESDIQPTVLQRDRVLNYMAPFVAEVGCLDVT